MSNFKTTDIVLAAFLRLSGCLLSDIERQGQKGTFVFCDVDNKLIDDYDLGKAQVEPVAFNNMIKHLTTCVRRMS